ncbi:MAG: DNA-directed RNA polymerase subunit beta' [Acidothermus cellulolyticus]|nr:DNA-directed RNA polymerase subunit beta' [Acidothermus cellulolyticus]MCL6549943.1 DNA-directed RNA polymerase subunit beta' [Acidothermus cellulolyticus]
MLDVNYFDELRIGLATADDIRQWSHGEVKKPETINYRTLRPEKDGLFCERIFGPTRDWECYCGKYKRVRFKGIICERCGVEVTRSKVRRERMGHIELAAPVTHIWYFKGVPSRLGYLLDLAPKDLEKVIYFAAYMITWVDEEARHRDLPSLEAQISVEKQEIEKRMNVELEERARKLEEDLAALEAEGAKADAKRKVREAAEREMRQIRERAQKEIDRIDEVFTRFKNLKVQDLEGDEVLYRELRDRFGQYFRGGMGAQAIKERLESFNLEAEAEALREQIRNGRGQKKARALKRLKVISAFLNTRNSPMGMVLDCIPVIPPDLRPMVQLDGGRFATSDLNDLYRRVINRNNRLKRLLDLGAPEIIVNNEKRMLQEAVDALFDNGRRGRPVTGPGNRPLKSLSDMLKGKQGRFRQNLLGKRVDYSGRSVIVVGPQLKLHQCGLPKVMALELFKPFVMKRLVDLNHAQNIKSAKRMVERATSGLSRYAMVWDVLEEVIKEHPVLLNRAPTLHRLGIQAFEPQLVEGKAIQIHPLVCAAFNADFDGDQMAVHLPLSAEAQAEARILMLSSNNILKPADGRPVTMPSQDMVFGIYYLTTIKPGATGEGRVFSSDAEAIMARDLGELDIQAKIKVRLKDVVAVDDGTGSWTPPDGWQPGDPLLVETTLGRILFNEALPPDYRFINYELTKKDLSTIVNDLAERYPKVMVAACLDEMKTLGFHWATRAGVTISISDVVMPPRKQEILEAYEAKAEKVQRQYERGLITDDERRQELIEIWTQATADVAREMEANFPKDNPVFMMVNSGARGNMMQVRQIAGMRGLVANPKGEIIPRPIKSNFREGLSVLEYFISTHGARKGLADTALRTADSGYLTRRLVDVSQDVIVREEDCGTERAISMRIGVKGPDGTLTRLPTVETSVYARTLAEDVIVDGKVLAAKGSDIGDLTITELLAHGVEQVRVRSVLTCESKLGVCAACYGRSLASGKLVDVGEAVGIIAAQSIGEPGTQLTMRTFHTGGVAGEDITHGLPRVVELFEARTPKGVAPISEVTGRVKIEETEKARKIIITPDDGSEEVSYQVSKRARLRVAEGEHVEVGTQLVEGTVNPHEVLRILGPRAVQVHLVQEVQEVYRSQGVPIHDKHIEIIVRQMLKRVNILESGDTEFLPGELVERPKFEEENRRVVAEGGTPATARPVLMGITKASLATESWLSAASFQETTRVLTDAAINAKSDPLLGLKENVIIGKLIPAGTGMPRYRNIRVEPTEEARAAVYSMSGYDTGSYASGYGQFGTGSGQAVPLDDYDYGSYDR